MSSTIYDIVQLSNTDLKKLVSDYISLKDIYDECEKCGRPILLHQQAREECTREVDEGLDVIAKNWSLLKKRLKPILKEIKEERAEEKKQRVYLDGIERIVNTLKMNWDPLSDTKEKKSNPT